MSHAETLDVSDRSRFWHSQILRFLRECRLPTHLMFQQDQCFDRVKVWGSPGNVACRHTWCISEVNASKRSKFEVPQGMLLAGILEASVGLINALTLSKFDVLRECRSPAHSMFQWGQCLDRVKVWGSSWNVARRHTWCFSKVNASTRSKFERPQGLSLDGKLNVSARSKHRQAKFEVPQGMLLAGILDASASSMF